MKSCKVSNGENKQTENQYKHMVSKDKIDQKNKVNKTIVKVKDNEPEMKHHNTPYHNCRIML